MIYKIKEKEFKSREEIYDYLSLLPMSEKVGLGIKIINTDNNKIYTLNLGTGVSFEAAEREVM